MYISEKKIIFKVRDDLNIYGLKQLELILISHVVLLEQSTNIHQ